MKANMKYIFLTSLILLSGFLFCQTDSSDVVYYENLNMDVKTVILPSLFNLLGTWGINITPFAGLISIAVVFILRHYEKKKLKEETAEKIRSVVVSGYSKASQPIPEVHQHALRKIIDKLEGVKEKIF
jgi:hypothetical protein